MKHIYSLILCVLCATQLTAQSDLLGQWYLDYVEVDNVIHNNYYNEQQDMGINFSNTEITPGDFVFSGVSSCNFLDGGYSATSNSITINSLIVTSVDCSTTPRGVYELVFLSVLQNNIPSAPFNLSYTVTGTGMDQVLTLTNPSGDSAVFSKTPGTILLVQTWYLSRIEIPGNPNIDVPVSETPTMTLTNDIDFAFFEPEAIGFGTCNAFDCDYNIGFNTDGDVILIRNFVETLDACSSTYESAYFGTLGNPASNYFVFEIVNNGQTLRMTDLLGVTLVFGDNALSVDEQVLRTELTLKNNPIENIIEFANPSEILNDGNFELISLTGKIIKSGKFSSDKQIHTDGLKPGLYLLRVEIDQTMSQVFKILKE